MPLPVGPPRLYAPLGLIGRPGNDSPQPPGDNVNASSDARVRKGSAREQAYQSHVRELQDRLLLLLRDGDWRPRADLAAWLAPRLLPEHAVQRYHDAGGASDKKLDHKCGEGQKLVLQDLLDTLQARELLAVRRGPAGPEVRATPRSDERFAIDPEFENLLPRAPDEVHKLEERLLVEEARDPLVVWKGQRTLVDGHTRFRFFSLLGRSYPIVEMDFPDRGAAIAWMRASHYGRRSYSAEMKAYVRGTDYLARKQTHGGARSRASPHRGNLRTADAVAAEYRTGRNTILRDAAFAQALDAVAADCGDEVRQQVLSRQAPWTRRDVLRLAREDREAMPDIVRAALASGQRPRFPTPEADSRSAGKTVSLPLGKPAEQVRALRKVLGSKGLARLHLALGRFLEKRKRPPSD